jgi:hypothetical protein
MRFTGALGVTVVVVTMVGSMIATDAGAQGAKPKAQDVGITATQIRLAVIADVDTPVDPGLFQSAVDTMRAWAALVNKHGGIAGRQVVIDFIDSKLSDTDARNAVIKACSQDFAMVGGEALFLDNLSDGIACQDAQGKPTGLPDLPGLALDTNERCAPVTYVASGDTGFCATRDQHPQTYFSQRGDGLFYVKMNKHLHGVFLVPNDLKATQISQQADFQAVVDSGIKKDGAGFYDTTAQAPQSALTPIVQVVKNNQSNFVYNGEAFGTMVLLRREAKLQGVNSVKIWACNQGCYDANFLQQGGADIEGTYTVLTTLPFFTEYKSNPALKALVGQLGGLGKLNSDGVAAYTGALLFQDAAQKAVASGGTLTRQTLFNALKTEHHFTAQGVIGPTDIASRKSQTCIVMAQVKNGKWVRVSPTKSGTFDCSQKNVLEQQLDLG